MFVTCFKIFKLKKKVNKYLFDNLTMWIVFLWTLITSKIDQNSHWCWLWLNIITDFIFIIREKTTLYIKIIIKNKINRL